MADPDQASPFGLTGNPPEQAATPVGPSSLTAPFGLGLPGNAGDFLDPDVAYVLSAEAVGSKRIVIRWAIADGYYLYRDKFKFALKEGPGIELESVRIPPGKIKEDPYFGRVEVFYSSVEASVALRRPAAKEAATIMLDVGYQGCADAGLCYVPITKTVPLMLPAAPD